MNRIKQTKQSPNDKSLEYEDDILKVKKIWNDLKNVNTNKSLSKDNKKYPQTSQKNNKAAKNVQNKKQTVYSKKVKQPINQRQQLKSTRRTPKNQKSQKTDIIQFSTKVINNQQPHSSVKQNNFFRNINNEKNKIIQENLFLDSLSMINNNQGKDFVISNNNNKNLNIEIHNLQDEIEKKDTEISLLRVTNQRNQDKIRELERDLQEKEQIIHKMKQRQNQLLGQKCELNSEKLNFDYGKVEYENFKNDSRRLLKMLQSTQEYQTFANIAIEDQGVRFLHQVNKYKKSKIDLMSSTKPKIHFCTCNKQFLPESGFWVPQKVYNYARGFVKERDGRICDAEVQLMLYELNRFWREREKKIVNSMNALKAHEVSKYKRKIENLNHSPDNILQQQQ